MFRQSLLPRACLMLALGLTLFSAPAFSPSAGAQERSLYERLDRLERDLNMLQRQTFRGGAPVPTYPPDGPAAVNGQLRMDRLEADMRDLTGRVEEYANRVEQLRRRVEQLNGETELRVDRSSSPAGAGPAPQSPAVMPPARSGPGGPPRLPRPLTTPEPLGSYESEPGPSPNGPLFRGPTPISGTLTPPGTPPGSPPRPNEPGSAVAPAPVSDRVLPGGSAAEQYNYAFGLMKQANYPDAEAAFKEFVAAHPKDQMAGNAQYWLGETYYARGKYMEAATAFAEGYKRYPKSTKTPDMLLKLGMSLARADQKQNACVALAKLGQEFPKAAASVRQRAVAEMKNLGC